MTSFFLCVPKLMEVDRARWNLLEAQKKGEARVWYFEEVIKSWDAKEWIKFLVLMSVHK